MPSAASAATVGRMTAAYASAVAIAVLAGGLLSVQIATNRRLGDALAAPLWSATVSFIVGLTGLLLCCLAFRQLPSVEGARAAPWWAWIGGLLGAFYVASTIILLPRLGATTLTGLVVGGQILAAVVIDHYGWLGVATQPVTLGKLAGAALLVIGAVLVMRG